MKQFNLPWHLSEHYWIRLDPKHSSLPANLVPLLVTIGMKQQGDGAMIIKTETKWKIVWDRIDSAIQQAGAADAVDAIVTDTPEAPHSKLIPDHKSVIDPRVMAGSLWVGDALLDDRIMCYLQPVMNAKNQIFGYESFARIKKTDGTIIDGADIVAASKTLGIEHMIDRHLHVQAIMTFANSEFPGFLFINFFPGFIHRPAVYLEGLSETAKRHGVIAKHIVLDFTKSETPHDLMHIKNVSEYGRSCGYSVALDDITSVDMVRRLVKEIRPDFVKIDTHLVQMVLDNGKRETIRIIVELVHAAGGVVIAEGVELPEIYEALKLLGVDLFQGYLFSPPVPVEAALKRGSAV